MQTPADRIPSDTPTAFFIYESTADNSIRVDDHLTTDTPFGQKSYSHHDCFELYFFEQGELSFSAEGNILSVTPGDLIIVRPHVMHGVLINRAGLYHRKHIFFRDNLFQTSQPGAAKLYERLLRREILKLDNTFIRMHGLDRLIDHIIRSVCRHTAYDDFCAVAGLYHLLIQCVEYQSQIPQPQIRIHNQKIHDILHYIDAHIAEPMDYPTLADLFFVSEKNLYHIFKKETGLSPARYINERRIIKAKLLMHQGYPATEAAELTGFQDYSVFYRNFKKAAGVSPADYLKGIRPPFPSD